MADVELRAYIAEIEDILAVENNDEAVAHCRHILEYFPKYIAVYRLLGKGYLEQHRYLDAADIFYRVLSASPDDFVAHAGLAIIREEEGNLDEAIGHMQRSFEAQPNNDAIQTELRRLYSQRDGDEPERIRLTRGALARLYLKGGNISQAINELRAELEQDPDRLDYQIILAEALWKNEQRIEAAEICLGVLEKIPYCLDANWILFQILSSGGRLDEADIHRQRVEMLDPYYITEHGKLIGLVIEPPNLQIPRLDFVAPTPDEVLGIPEWVQDLGLGFEEPILPGKIISDQVIPESPAPIPQQEPFSSEVEEGDAVPDWLRDMAFPQDEFEAETVGLSASDLDIDPVSIDGDNGHDREQEDLGIGKLQFEKSGEDTIVSKKAAEPEEELPDWLADAIEWQRADSTTQKQDSSEQDSGDWLSQFEKPEDEFQTAPSFDEKTPKTFKSTDVFDQKERELEAPKDQEESYDQEEDFPPLDFFQDHLQEQSLEQEAKTGDGVPLAIDAEFPFDWQPGELEELDFPVEEQKPAGSKVPVYSDAEEKVMPYDKDETIPGSDEWEGIPSDPDDALAWLERLAAQQESQPRLEEEKEPEETFEEIPDWLKELALTDDQTTLVQKAPEKKEIEPFELSGEQQIETLAFEQPSSKEPSAEDTLISAKALSAGVEMHQDRTGHEPAKEEREFGKPEGEDLQEPSEYHAAMSWLDRLSPAQVYKDEEFTGLEPEPELVAESPEEIEPESELPEWLEEGIEPESQSPEWLDEEAELEAQPPEWLEEEAEAESPLPEWLEEEAEAESPLPEWFKEEPEPESHLPEWLEEESSPETLIPEWIEEEPEPEIELPEWLEEKRPAETPVSELEEEEIEPEFEWLEESSSPEIPVLVPEEEEIKPEFEPDEWLEESSSPEIPVSELEEEELEPEFELPDWLKESSSPIAPVEKLIKEEPEPEFELPEWLQESSSPQIPVSELEEEEIEPEFELPEWLTRRSDQVPGSKPEPMAKRPPFEIPDVKQPVMDMGSIITPPSAAPVKPVKAAEIEPMPDDVEEAMAWLERLAAREGAPIEELPSFIGKESAADETLPGKVQTVQFIPTKPKPLAPMPEQGPADIKPSTQLPAAPLGETELPDWVRMLEPESVAGQPKQEPEYVHEEWIEDSAKEPPGEETYIQELEPELPEWLRDYEPDHAEDKKAQASDWLLEPEDKEPPESAAEMEEEKEEEIPEWLLDVEPEPESYKEELDLPDWLRAPDTYIPEREKEQLSSEFVSPPESVASLADSIRELDEIPDWLSGEEVFEPTPKEPAEFVLPEPVEPIEEETMVTPIDEDLEIPDWLKEEPVELVQEEPYPAPELSSEDLSAIDQEEEFELPDWLQEEISKVPIPTTTEETVMQESELIEPEEEIPTKIPESKEREIEPAFSNEEMELPDWLKEEIIQREEPEYFEPEPPMETPEAETLPAGIPEAEFPFEELEPETWPEEAFPIEELEPETLPDAGVSPAEELVPETLPDAGVSPAEELVPEMAGIESLESRSDVEALRQTLAESPEDNASRLTLARQLMGEDAVEEALIEYNVLINDEQELDQVLDDLEQVVSSNPEQIRAWQLLGDVYMLQDDLEGALHAYHKALEQLD